MPPLEDALAGLASAPVLLVAVDFDGTLAPIVDSPPDARATPRSLRALAALSGQPRTHVAVISGRALSDLAARLGPAEDGVLLVGSHGAEFAPESVGGLTAEQHALVATIRAAVDAAAEGLAGLATEHKVASSTLHYRTASREVAAEALRRLRRAWSRAPLARARRRRGKKVVELLAVEGDKGDALAALRAELGATQIVFIGDDRTDEDAFRKLGPRDVAVKVGPGPTVAAHRVGGPSEVADLLVRLADLRGAVT